MKGIEPKDIPPSGNYDFVCTKRSFLLPGDNIDTPFIHAVIDAGPFKGKRVSGRADVKPHQRFSAYLTVESKARVGRDLVDVPVDYKDSDVYITYTLSDVDAPMYRPEYHLKTKNKFRR